MGRLIVPVILALLLAGALVFGFFYYLEQQVPEEDPWRAIPPSAAMILEVNAAPDTWNELVGQNRVWQELMTVPGIQAIDSNMKGLDSLWKGSESLKEIVQKQGFLISFHPAGKGKLAPLFYCGLPEGIAPDQVLEDIKKMTSRGWTTSSKTFDGVEIQIVNGKTPATSFGYLVHNGIFIGSFSLILLEEAVTHLNSGTPLHESPALKKLISTSGQDRAANLYLNHKLLPGILGLPLATKVRELIGSWSNVAEWTSLDVKIHEDKLVLNGFSYVSEPSHYFSILKDTLPERLRFQNVLPDYTSSMLVLGTGNSAEFRKRYEAFLESTGGLNAYQTYLDKLKKEHAIDLREEFFSWTGNEFGWFIPDEEFAPAPGEGVAFFHTDDPELASEQLELMSTGLVGEQPVDSASEGTITSDIIELPLSDLLPNVFGGVFHPVQVNYACLMGEFVFMAPRKSLLSDLINAYKTDHTLSKSLNFVEFYGENLAPTSNLLFYHNPARSGGLYQRLANDQVKQLIGEQEATFNNFDALCFQSSYEEGDLFYSNLILRHNPEGKTVNKTLWETALDTTFSRKPDLLINHNTKAQEVFIQDHSNRIYLISSSGRVLWKREVDGPILGKVHQIDALANNKLQMLFNTGSQLYLIDRNGRDVGKFPIDLEAEASAGLSAFDYDKKKVYRILVPVATNKVLNFDQKGNQVKGWKMTTSAPVSHPIWHFSLDDKDYVVALDSDGQVYVVDRRGEKRLSIENKLPAPVREDCFLETARHIDEVRLLTTDSAGQVIRLYFNNHTDTLRLDSFSDQHRFFYRNINQDKGWELIFTDTNRLVIYDQNSLRLFQKFRESGFSGAPLLFRFPGEVTEIGTVDKTEQRLFLYNEVGTLKDGFPLKGSTPFSIGDLNRDGKLDLVVGNQGKIVYTYTID